MTREEKTMKSERIYEGKVINLRVDTVELPERKYSKREIVEHSGGVAVLAITKDKKLVLVKQYRKSVEDILIELPAGRIEADEDPETTAIRELLEETGYIPESIKKMTEAYSSPGYTNEIIHIYLAENLNKSEANPDEDEYIEVIYLTIEEAIKKIILGEIKDNKTISGILLYQSIFLDKN